MHICCAKVAVLVRFVTGRLRGTIERLDSLNIVIRKHEVTAARVGIDGKHQGSWVLGVVQT